MEAQSPEDSDNGGKDEDDHQDMHSLPSYRESGKSRLAFACAAALLAVACAGVSTRADESPRLSGIRIIATPGGVGPLTPPFSPDIMTYSLSANSDIVEIEIIPSVSVPASLSISMNGAPVSSGTAAGVKLNVGDNRISLAVSSAAGPGPTYTIICRREVIEPVENAFLKLSYADEETGVTMVYRLFVPPGYTPSKSWPLVLFLHGAGESGSDNNAQLVSNRSASVWAKPDEQARHACFVLAPQNPMVLGAFALSPYGARGWTSLLSRGFGSPFQPEAPLAAVYNLLQKLMGEFSIDANRLYATGLSMGGFGVMALNAAHPETFAAIVSVCGGLDPAQAPKLARKPIWLFHAAEDPLVSVRFSRAAVEALRAAGGSPRYTEYPPGTRFIGSSAHNSWVAAFADAAMRDWLFAQRRNFP
jgi:predicted esterase